MRPYQSEQVKGAYSLEGDHQADGCSAILLGAAKCCCITGGGTANKGDELPIVIVVVTGAYQQTTLSLTNEIPN